MISTSPRAAPLPPDERRAALIASTLALVLAEGPDVNTRQIAQAAGVAEGTIFRVFATKDELVYEAVSSAFDSSPLVHDLTAIDRAAPLRARLVAVVEILRSHTARIFRLMDALGVEKAAELDRERRARLAQEAGETNCATTHDPRIIVRQAIVNLIDPDRDQLRCTPHDAARRLHLMTIAGSHPRLVEDDPLSPADIVSTLLDGIRLRPEDDTARPAHRDTSHLEPPAPGTSDPDAPAPGAPNLDTPRGDPPC
ncbi:TetR/AcrR family transcriptional regulator [Streptosporangium sp. NPDC051023]|uniref:TetR/AcrR family transcriptional regulator n=1 Tax=Streptosporangium sp. NPDC051023 TaxID=3155410 RepID=UPI00344FA3FF